MQSDKYIQLIYRQLKGEISPVERAELRAWENEDPVHHRKAEQIRRVWDDSAETDYELPFELDAEADFAKVQARLQKPASGTGESVKMTPRRNWLRVAAAVTLLLVTGWLLRNFMISKPEMKTVTASTEIKRFDLADGTAVWLNKGSSLTYPQEFQREVTLSGEAYFAVAKDAQKRFRVTTDETTVTVLGTVFNVKESKKTGLTEISVSEGKVRVQAKSDSAQVDLIANETAVYDASARTLTENKDKNLNGLAWQRKSLRFNDTTLQNVLFEIETYFGTEIELENAGLANCKVSGRYKTDGGAEEVLGNIGAFFGAKTKRVANNKYILSGGKCR